MKTYLSWDLCAPLVKKKEAKGNNGSVGKEDTSLPSRGERVNERLPVDKSVGIPDGGANSEQLQNGKT